MIWVDFIKSSLVWLVYVGRYYALLCFRDLQNRYLHQVNDADTPFSFTNKKAKRRRRQNKNLSAEAVEGLALTLEGVDDVHGGDGLSASVLGVGDGITDDVLKEDLEDTAGLLVDEAGDTLDTATTGETANGGLGDTLDVVAKDLAMTLGATLSESLASLAAS